MGWCCVRVIQLATAESFAPPELELLDVGSCGLCSVDILDLCVDCQPTSRTVAAWRWQAYSLASSGWATSWPSRTSARLFGLCALALSELFVSLVHSGNVSSAAQCIQVEARCRGC